MFAVPYPFRMKFFYRVKPLTEQLHALRTQEAKIGFVPTMGALHEGHLSLVRRALSENEAAVVSIFVNPTQFDKPEDLQKYPRDQESDLEKLGKLGSRLIAFCPPIEELYPEGVQVAAFDFGGLERTMEGVHRQGHFNGVATIVQKLFEVVSPTHAYFGEKDYQQLRIVAQLVKQQALPIQVVGCPILREPNGLAMSSRNERLSPEMRQKAGFIYRILLAAAGHFRTQSARALKNWIIRELARHPEVTVEYVEIAHAETLLPLHRKKPRQPYRLFVALYVEGVRLIDNIPLPT